MLLGSFFSLVAFRSYRQHDELESMKILAETSEFSKGAADCVSPADRPKTFPIKDWGMSH
jgi:hypothetical protein